MAKKNREGKFIIAAGEVGQYAVCPEAWRLKVVERVTSEQSIASIEGEKLHSKWSSNLDNAAHLGQGIRFLLALVATILIIVIMFR